MVFGNSSNLMHRHHCDKIHSHGMTFEGTFREACLLCQLAETMQHDLTFVNSIVHQCKIFISCTPGILFMDPPRYSF